MNKKEINEKYGIISERFSDKALEELHRPLTEEEVKVYVNEIESFINYLQTNLKS